MAKAETRHPALWIDRALMGIAVSIVFAVAFDVPGRLQGNVDLRLAYGRLGIATEEAASILILLPVAVLALALTGAWQRFRNAGSFRWWMAAGAVLWLVMDRNGLWVPAMAALTARPWLQFAGLVMVSVGCAAALAAGSRTPEGAPR